MLSARRIGRHTLLCAPLVPNHSTHRAISVSSTLYSSVQSREDQMRSELSKLIHDHTRAFALDKAGVDNAALEAETNEFAQNLRNQGVQLSEPQLATLKDLLQFKLAALQAKKQVASPEEYKRFDEAVKKLEAEAIRPKKTPVGAPKAGNSSVPPGSLYSVVLTAIEQVEAEDNYLAQRFNELFPSKPIAMDIFQTSREALNRAKKLLLRSATEQAQATEATSQEESEDTDLVSVTASWLQDGKNVDAARLQKFAEGLEISPSSPHYTHLKEATAAISDKVPPAVSEFNNTVKAIREKRSALEKKPAPSTVPPELLVDNARDAYTRQHDEQAEFVGALRAFLASQSKPNEAQKLQFMKEQQAKFQRQRESFFSSLPGHPAPPSNAASDSVLLARFEAAVAKTQ